MSNNDQAEASTGRFTKQEVAFAYRLLRGGAKVNEAELGRLTANSANIDQLRRALTGQAGGRLHVGFQESIQQRFLKAPPPETEVDVAPEVLEALLTHVENVWRGFGESDPFWSVLTKFKPAGAEVDKDAFYATGRKRVEKFEAALVRNGVDAAALKTCLELGSGVGRLTLWLADRFARVTAADISSSHLTLAEQELTARGKTNVDYLRVASMAELAKAPPFDAFFSIISLQHSPPPVIKHVLGIMLGRLNPGGVGYFQLPTLIPEQKFDARAYLSDLSPHEQMETFAVPQKVLFALFDQLGLRVLEVREDNQCGPHKLSNTFLVQKPG